MILVFYLFFIYVKIHSFKNVTWRSTLFIPTHSHTHTRARARESDGANQENHTPQQHKMHVTACLAGRKVEVEVGEECRTLQALKKAESEMRTMRAPSAVEAGSGEGCLDGELLSGHTLPDCREREACPAVEEITPAANVPWGGTQARSPYFRVADLVSNLIPQRRFTG